MCTRAAVALGDEVDGEPRLRPAALVGAVALLDPARARSRRSGGTWAVRNIAGRPGRGAAGGVPQRLRAGVVGVAEVRAVRRQRGAAAGDHHRVDRRQRQQPVAEQSGRGAACRRPRGTCGPRDAARPGGAPAWTALDRRAPAKAPIAEWKVPPENIAAARTTPRTVTGPVGRELLDGVAAHRGRAGSSRSRRRARSGRRCARRSRGGRGTSGRRTPARRSGRRSRCRPRRRRPPAARRTRGRGRPS